MAAPRIALIGSYPPRRCGIATFTSDLRDALLHSHPASVCDVYAMTESGAARVYPSAVKAQIRQDAIEDYEGMAAAINLARIDLVCVQHEYGIFGGAAGEHLLTLLDRVRAPVVTTLHTVLAKPDPDQRRVFTRLARRSSRLIVMAEKGRDILLDEYRIPEAKISIIAHGVPDQGFVECGPYKHVLGLVGRDVLLTFGLLSPNKGIEVMIRALPSIKSARPDALYVVLGATHPKLYALEGEAYRERLKALAEELGVSAQVRFVDEYVDHEKLLSYLAAADLYITPYLNEAQITSGTLSYAIGLGKAVVSTPYWHAKELLADDRGVIVPFLDTEALAEASIELLQDSARRDRIRANAYSIGRDMIWARAAEQYNAVFAEVRARKAPIRASPSATPPAPSLKGVERHTDHCGILQHSTYGVPDRAHGYCVDDNARALILVHRLEGMGFARAALDRLATIYAAFVNHAWNADRCEFRNFMGYDQSWLEASGSHDSSGRSYWALGVTAELAAREDLRLWAFSLAERALDCTRRLGSTRARAFFVLGLASLVSARPSNMQARSALRDLSGQLLGLWRSERRRDGEEWFEPQLGYDNARLPEALLRAGAVLEDRALIDAGLTTLAWLCEVQTSPSDCFRPIGSECLGKPLSEVSPFDQQPLEAAATIDACTAAYEASGDASWVSQAQRAFSWFMGENDLAVPVALPSEGLCYDGLTPLGPNRNHGAESILSFQLAVASMHALLQADKRPKKADTRWSPAREAGRIRPTAAL